MNDTTKVVCGQCGVTTVMIPANKADLVREKVPSKEPKDYALTRDYEPTIIRLKLRDTNTSYIVSPETEAVLRRLPFHVIRGCDAGKTNYEIVVSLPENGDLMRALSIDQNIEEWHTEDRGDVCHDHRDFDKYRLVSR